MSRSSRRLFTLLGSVLLVVSQLGAATSVLAHNDDHSSGSGKAIFFAADGMRQDLVEQYAAQGVMPTMRSFLRNGTLRVRERPADAGAAEHRRGLVHASRPARGRASPARPTTPSTSQRPALRQPHGGVRPRDVLQAESIAQSAERGGLKVAQVEWAGGRNATINGPTIDFQTFFSGRGVATNFIGTSADAALRRRRVHLGPRPAVRPPRRLRGPGGLPGAAPTDADRLDRRARSRTARPRRCGCGSSTAASTSTASTPTSSTAPTTTGPTTTGCCSRPTKDGADAVGDLAQGQWADVKVKIVGGALDGKTAGHAGQGRGALRATCPGSACSTPR